ncbi:MAG: hypothetical protein HY505_01150 [Candidatus Yanofskybacteria bacterium]|nr:hypothetical protein [Candidatus Yanofskybacteria bacterium]
MITNFSERKLEMLIGESVRRVLKEELMRLYALAVPDISKSEQREIEKLYGQPSKRSSKKVRIEL